MSIEYPFRWLSEELDTFCPPRGKPPYTIWSYHTREIRAHHSSLVPTWLDAIRAINQFYGKPDEIELRKADSFYISLPQITDGEGVIVFDFASLEDIKVLKIIWNATHTHKTPIE